METWMGLSVRKNLKTTPFLSNRAMRPIRI
jgi:hypothetical protein